MFQAQISGCQEENPQGCPQGILSLVGVTDGATDNCSLESAMGGRPGCRWGCVGWERAPRVQMGMWGRGTQGANRGCGGGAPRVRTGWGEGHPGCEGCGGGPRRRKGTAGRCSWVKVCGQHVLTAGIRPCYITAPGDNGNCSFAPMVYSF